MADLELIVEGRKWSRFRSAKVTKRMGSAAGSFDLTLDDRWTPGAPHLPFRGHAPVTVKVAGQTIITGLMDRVEPGYDKDRYTVRVSGRDRSGQLVDCCAPLAPGEWLDTSLDAIARELAEPFGVRVLVQTDVGAPFKKFTIKTGETVMAAISRACRHRGVLLMPDGVGNILLTTAGAGGRADSLVSGVNITKAKGVFDESQRYSTYTVMGQDDAVGWGDVSSHAAVQGFATDPAVTLHRPWIDVAEVKGNRDDLTRTAQTQASIAAGRARRAEITVPSWTQSDGRTWSPNKRASINDGFLRLADEMLIEGVSLDLEGDRETAVISVVHPDAWKIAALPERDSEGLGW